MSRTITISESLVLDRSPAEVWAYVEDYDNDIAWRAGLTEMTPTPPGPPRVGTQVHEVVRKLGSTYVTRSTVTEVGPGYRYRFSGHGDSGRVCGGRTVVEDDDGRAVFTYDIELHLTGFTAFLAPVVRRIMTAGLRNDLVALGAVLADHEPETTPIGVATT